MVLGLSCCQRLGRLHVGWADPLLMLGVPVLLPYAKLCIFADLAHTKVIVETNGDITKHLSSSSTGSRNQRNQIKVSVNVEITKFPFLSLLLIGNKENHWHRMPAPSTS
jgi:hypothetical protein